MKTHTFSNGVAVKGMSMKLGLSLSLCIKDIAEGKVKLEEVHHIITACSPSNQDDVFAILKNYCKVYWRNFPEKACVIYNELHSQHKISWLSSFDKNPLMIGGNYWLDWPE